MRRLLRSAATVIAAQPFYAEEMRALHLAIDLYRHRLPLLDRLFLN
ncbi:MULTISPECIES: hypothetical protein [Gluconobacter]|uniref:Uncharacterized protein n=1 Tax=Gluconobacter cerinus TaxID=38307 RepID=A0A1B6VGY0_9PROT|nr:MULTISPECIES: hypothetical protein [Gluconobacter]MBS1020230.1 hypothetical protein [Gluconobacter cerinus]MBS1063944.1 hypothetical protein [Gluconobacter wancherniae]MBS1069970.1 hypothetical protein [Gluconobacter cerinus]MBS1072720.1 hypothetical protein [Gluconobacter cerinus]MCP1237473.1 hypothetical protein [Gluconobacter kondonii]